MAQQHGAGLVHLAEGQRVVTVLRLEEALRRLGRVVAAPHEDRGDRGRQPEGAPNAIRGGHGIGVDRPACDLGQHAPIVGGREDGMARKGPVTHHVHGVCCRHKPGTLPGTIVCCSSFFRSQKQPGSLKVRSPARVATARGRSLPAARRIDARQRGVGVRLPGLRGGRPAARARRAAELRGHARGRDRGLRRHAARPARRVLRLRRRRPARALGRLRPARRPVHGRPGGPQDTTPSSASRTCSRCTRSTRSAPATATWWATAWRRSAGSAARRISTRWA